MASSVSEKEKEIREKSLALGASALYYDFFRYTFTTKTNFDKFIETKPDNNKILTVYGMACRYGRMDFIGYIDIDRNIPFTNANLAIFMNEACFNGHKNIVDYLYMNNKNIFSYEIKNKIQFILNAIQHDKECKTVNEKVDFIVHILNYFGKDIDIHHDDDVIFREACYRGVKVAELIYDRYPDVNIRALNDTPLKNACMKGDLKLIDKLFSWDNTINVRRNNDSLVMTACGYQNHELLIKLFTINNTLDLHYNNDCPFMTACQNGYGKFLETMFQLIGKDSFKYELINTKTIKVNNKTIKIVTNIYNILTGNHIPLTPHPSNIINETF